MEDRFIGQSLHERQDLCFCANRGTSEQVSGERSESIQQDGGAINQAAASSSHIDQSASALLLSCVELDNRRLLLDMEANHSHRQ
jgi:hypothetical protein